MLPPTQRASAFVVLCTSILLVLTFATSVAAEQPGYVMVGMGGGGHNGAFNIVFEAMGVVKPKASSSQLSFLVGLGGGISATSDPIPDFVDTRIPHGDFTNTGYLKNGPELEMYMRGQVGMSSELFIGPTLGIAVQRTIAFAHSNVTGWYWENGMDRDIYPTIGIGAILLLTEKVIASLDFSNRRGIDFGIGLRL